MKHDIEQLLITVIQDVLKELDLYRLFQNKIYLDFPSDPRFGDLSTNAALQLSKIVKKSPQEIAKTIVDSIKTKLEKSPYQDYVREVKAEGQGFINFYINDKYFFEEIKNLIKKPEAALKRNTGKNKKVLIEFVSANPTGPLSVAHARQAAVGDALTNILDFLGFRVKREYYLNDEGNQIDILGKTLEIRLKQLNGERIELPEDHYQGEYMCEIAKKIRNKKSTLRLRSGLMVSAVEPSKIKNFSDYAIKYILDIIKKELEDFGVKFDYWYSQKELRKSGKIEKALDFLKEKGFLYEQDQALWFKSSAFGDDKDRVVIKSDGSYTYVAADIAYHQEKYKRGFDWLINFWGPDHHGYVSRLKAAIQALGYAPDSLSIIIVQLASIFREGKSIEMSTRKGQYITLREVLDEVGRDASRFFFLMRRTHSHLDFDLDTAKKQTPENPVYYVQYAHARIYSILSKRKVKLKRTLDFSVLKEKEELALIKKLLRFSYTLNICLSTQDPYMLTVYLQELAETFHKFYDLHRVLGDDDRLTQARLSLIEATKLVIAKGLDLLGISKPEKM